MDEAYVCTATNQGVTRCDHYFKWPRAYVNVSTPGDYTLTINNVTVDDSGLYHCVEEGGAGTRHTISLNVTLSTAARSSKIKLIAVSVLVSPAVLVSATCIIWFVRKRCQVEPRKKNIEPEPERKQVEGNDDAVLLKSHHVPFQEGDEQGAKRSPVIRSRPDSGYETLFKEQHVSHEQQTIDQSV